MGVRQEVRVLGCLVPGHRGCGGHLDAAQPLDARIAFVTGQEQPHRIAVLRSQSFAVLVERQQRVIHRLGQRHATAHRRRIGAFGQYPVRGGVDARLVEQDGQRHAGPFAARDQTVEFPAGPVDGFRRKPRHPAVAGTFDELNARDHRVTRQRIQIEEQRAIDQPVNEQAMRVRIDIRNAAVVALEVQRTRRDHPFEHFQRRA